MCDTCKPDFILLVIGSERSCVASLPPSTGIDPYYSRLPLARVCEADHCLACAADYLACTSCKSDFYLTAAGGCSRCDFTGVFRVGRRCEECSRSCVKCRDAADACTECDTANGYILVSGSCVVGVEVTLTCQPVNGSSASLAFAFAPSPPLNQTALAQLAPLLTIQAYSSTGQ